MGERPDAVERRIDRPAGTSQRRCLHGHWTRRCDTGPKVILFYPSTSRPLTRLLQGEQKSVKTRIERESRDCSATKQENNAAGRNIDTITNQDQDCLCVLLFCSVCVGGLKSVRGSIMIGCGFSSTFTLFAHHQPTTARPHRKMTTPHPTTGNNNAKMIYSWLQPCARNGL